jgi:NAD(P)-dependent dehydrogenase (short-subunit alcohol dehydrogenase family)
MTAQADSISVSNTSRVALVTGAATRIGAAISKRLAREGWQVVVHHRRSAEQAEATISDILASGGKAAGLRADLTDRAERARVIAEASKPFGPLTLLVNNASVFERDSVADLDEELWDAHFAIHAEAPAFLSRDFAAQLPTGAHGNIINIIDERVLDLSPAFFSYTLSKSVLWTMTRTLAQTLAPHIRVNAIGPGPTVAPPGVSEAAYKKRQAELPLGRGADPGGIGDGVMAILSLDAMTGQMILLDGGEHIEYPERRKPTPRRP